MVVSATAYGQQPPQASDPKAPAKSPAEATPAQPAPTAAGKPLPIPPRAKAVEQPSDRGEKDLSDLPPAPARLWVIAPSAKGQWLVRIDNTGEQRLHIVADVRLLRFEVRAWDEKSDAYPKQAEICDGPASFGLENELPFGRELVLEKGESWVETFDPRLICFGTQAKLLAPNSIIAPTYGFVPRAANLPIKLADAPFVADTAEAPRTVAPVKRLDGPTMLLSHAPPAVFPPYDQSLKAERDARAAELVARSPASAEEASRHAPAAPQAPYRAPKDGLGAAVSLTTDHFADASSRRNISFEVEAHNVGDRPIWVALRARQLAFDVHGSDGRSYCGRVSADHHVPRDMFQLLHAGKHFHVPVLLGEICPAQLFQRPGLYAVVPTLHADDNGSEYGIVALTGQVSTREPGEVGGTHVIDDDATLVRVRTGPRPFYLDVPRAIPTNSAPAAPVDPQASETADAR
jgi:hypothetical protein